MYMLSKRLYLAYKTIHFFIVLWTVMAQHTNIVVASNIGLTGSEIVFDQIEEADRNNIVKAKISDTCTEITKRWGRPTVLALQETGGFNFEPAPFFHRPLATDEHVNTGTQGKGRKGVCTWTIDPEAFELTPLDDHHEIATIVKTYINKQGHKRKIGLINCYRNTHKEHARSVDSTVTAIRRIMGKLIRDHKIRTFAAFGDFNTEKWMDFGHGMKEKSHDKLFHKHNDSTRKTRIDRLFTNCSELEFLDILPTLENKKTGENLRDLGHKTMVFYIGRPPTPPRKHLKKCINIKDLKDYSKTTEPNFRIKVNEDKEARNYSSEELDELTTELLLMIDNYMEMASSERMVKEQTVEHALWSEVQRGEDEMEQGKKQEKTFYRLIGNLKNGLQDSDTSVKPPLSDLRDKLEKKMAKLNPTDIATGERIAKKLHTDVVRETNQCKNIETFRKIILGTSNSKAKDYLGHSLFHVKIIMQNSRPILRRAKLICEIAVATGYFPNELKIDNIIFLYKNKGNRNDAANWRPITLAPAFGKMIEKYIGFRIAGLNDRNHENHAYIANRSTQTAITDSINRITNAKIKAKAMNLVKKKVWVIASPDDISGAFESVDHHLVAYVMGLIFVDDRNSQISKLVKSYLDRRSFVIDEKGAERLEVRKTFMEKTTPQGSLLSPLFWRIYDALFTELYRESFDQILEENEEIIEIIHVAFADDHTTYVVFALDQDETDQTVAEYMSTLFDLVRGLLMDATKQLGCGVNPLKSESIVPPQFKNMIKLEHKTEKEPNDTFKWLGYHLSLDTNANLVFNEKEIDDKIKSIEYFRNLAFQYTRNMSLRWKIWKVYIAPFVELYLPLVIQSKPHKPTSVHRLQYQTICRVLGVPVTVCRRNLELKVGEKSIEEKSQRLADRLIRCLTLVRPDFGGTVGVSTRSMKGIVSNATNKNERNNFINRIFIVHKSNFEPTPKVKFCAKNLKPWIASVNANISKKRRNN